MLMNLPVKMKTLLVVGVLALTGSKSFALPPEVAAFRAPVQTPAEVEKGFVWVEAEGFADYGAWRLDTQFVDRMGSGYLIAAGVLQPIGRATTSLKVPSAGTWTVWARTKDWLPEYHPGTFRVTLGGRPGAMLGASGKDGWRWEKAGVWELPASSVDLALEDLSGAFARCDALLLTTRTDYVPPDDPTACAAARARFTGADTSVADGGEYDFVVVGAGPGGLSAALAAARKGVRVALVHDRPLLGGNASCELGVPTDGAAVTHENAREGGLCEEANLLRVVTREKNLSAAFARMTRELPTLTVVGNRRVERVEKAGERISAVIAHDTLTGRWTRFRGRFFLDGTGDGWVGRYAGADLLLGREAQSVYGEDPAPEKGDTMLMSGCLMGNYLGYQYRSAGKPVSYETPVWARVLPEGFVRNVQNPAGHWWIEHSGRFNELEDPERARDELVRINFAYWGWIKNEWKGKASAANLALAEMAYMNGRREGWRLRGDYILTGNDCQAGRVFDDRISYGGWPLDRHDPEGMENPTGNGYCPNHPNVPIYTIPFRILYSRNVPNLLMAGRNVSVSHVALGTVRVEATIMTMGQAAGTAVPHLLAKGLTPREYAADPANIRALQQELLKDDQYIPDVVNEDPDDLARGARVTATSCADFCVVPASAVTLRKSSGGRHELNMARATGFSREHLSELGAFRCWLENDRDESVTVTACVFVAADAAARADGRRQVGEVSSDVRPHARGFVMFRPSAPLPLDGAYVWVQLKKARGVFWRLTERDAVSGAARAYPEGGDWHVVPAARYAFAPADGFCQSVDAKPDYVIDGVSRPVGRCTHCWISDPTQPLPQSISLAFDEAKAVDEVRLTFDPDLNPLHPVAHPATLVKSYCLEGKTANGWMTLADEEENVLRLRVHRFPPVRVSELRVTVRSTWGDPSARIFEIRAYGNGKRRD